MKFTGGLKKTVGMSLIIVMSTLQIFFLFALIDTLITGEGPDINQTVFSFIFVMAIFSFPLNYGFKLWKAGRSGSTQVPALSGDEKTIRLSSKIYLTDYRNLMFKLTYSDWQWDDHI